MSDNPPDFYIPQYYAFEIFSLYFSGFSHCHELLLQVHQSAWVSLITNVPIQIKKEEPGIYYFVGDAIPIQLLITKELNLEENRWLGSLRSNIKNQSEIEAILKEYEEKKNSKLYQAAMEVIKELTGRQ